MSAESSIHTDASDRRARIEAIVDDVLHRRQAGENVPDEVVLGANRELIPELADAMRGVALVQEAWLRADQSHVSGGESAPSVVSSGPIELAGLAPPGYDVLELIHRGGQGVVYRAVQKSTRRVVAFKIMHEGPLTSREDKVRFDREVRVLAQLRHPNIVAIHDSGEWGGAFYLVMDFVEGRSLDEWWRQEAEAREHEKRPSRLRDAGSRSGDALRLFLKICDAVNAAHLLGIIHRDLKPSNIRVDAAGEPFVLDFGLAKLTGDSRVGAQSLAAVTETGQFVGSLPWASPEQVDTGGSTGRPGGQSAPLDMRTDVYSLGVMLYQLLTGRFPYNVTGAMREVIDRIVNAEPARPSTGPGDSRGSARSISSDLETIVLKCLAKERERRYQNAGELARDLRRFLAGEPVEAKRDSTLYVLRKRLARHRIAFGVGATIAALLAISSIVTWSLYVKADRAARDAETARGETTERLWQSYLLQARAKRQTTEAGRRFASLDALAKAAAIRPSLELRNEAVMAMSLVDLRVERILESGGDWGATWFDWNMKYYVLADSKGNLAVKSTDDSRELARFAGAGRSVRFIGISPDGRFVAAQYQDTLEPGGVRIFCLEQPGRAPRVYPGIQPAAFHFTPDNKSIGVAEAGGNHVIYDLENGREVNRFMVGAVVGACFAPDGRRIAVLGKKNNRIEVRELSSGESAAHLDLPDQHESLCYLRWHPDQDMLAVGCRDLSVTLWEPGTGRVRKLERADKQRQPYYIQFDQQGDLLASTGWEGVTRLWDWFNARQHVSIPGLGRAFSPDGRRMGFARYSASQKFEAAGIWELAVNRECRVLTLKKATAQSAGYPAAVSPDGSLIVAPDGPGLRIWDAHCGKDLAFIDTGRVYHYGVFSPSGESLITFGENGIFLWTLRRAAGVLHVGPPRVRYGYEVWPYSLSADGGALVANDSSDDKVVVLDLRKADGAKTIPKARANYGGVAINHDGSLVATSVGGQFAATGLAQDAQVKIWDPRSGALLQTLPPRGTFNLEFSQDGRWLLASNDEEYLVWDCASWQLAKHVARRTVTLTASAAASANGPTGAPAKDRVTYLDPRTLEPLLEIEVMTSPSVRFLPEDPLVPIALGVDPVIMLWDMRKVREQLAKMGLDWDAPPYPPEPPASPATPSRIEIDYGDFVPTSQPTSPSASQRLPQTRVTNGSLVQRE